MQGCIKIAAIQALCCDIGFDGFGFVEQPVEMLISYSFGDLSAPGWKYNPSNTSATVGAVDDEVQAEY